MENNYSKVYINPNRVSNNENLMSRHNLRIHVNPLFDRSVLNTKLREDDRHKIFINPNFICSSASTNKKISTLHQFTSHDKEVKTNIPKNNTVKPIFVNHAKIASFNVIKHGTPDQNYSKFKTISPNFLNCGTGKNTNIYDMIKNVHKNDENSGKFSVMLANTNLENFTNNSTNMIHPSTSCNQEFVHLTTCKNTVKSNSHNKYKKVNNIPTHSKEHTDSKVPISLVISNSKYSLVRSNIGSDPKKTFVRPKETIKLSKYKTVRINQIQKNIESSNNYNLNIISNKLINNKLLLRKSTTSLKVTHRNKYKLIKTRQFLNKSLGKLTKRTSIILNNSQKKKYEEKAKITNIFRLNNMPCPLYRKYGMCIRKDNGKCKYAHDKKHVSVCRKFIKGICHDKECLLSHDISNKKMPTCFFYLKGKCFKEDCPYLHVKLDDKAKVCSEFLKGYCENGDRCLKRHVVSVPDRVHKKRRESPKTYSLVKNSKVKRKKVKNNDSEKDNSSVNMLEGNVAEVKSKSTEEVKCRYYTDVENESKTSDDCEAIKPSRCKLGIIQEMKALLQYEENRGSKRN